MNREIKFRLWDNHYKELQFSSDGWHDRVDVLSQVWDYLTKSDYIIQQFTGLKDKSGKEIYEGDIVSFSRWGCSEHCIEIENYLCEGLKKIVFGLNYGEFPNAGFCAISINPTDLENGHTLNWMDQQNITILGNIFENPELI